MLYQFTFKVEIRLSSQKFNLILLIDASRDANLDL